MLHNTKRFLLALLALPLALTGCSGGPAPDSEEIDSDYYFIFGDNFDTKCHYLYKNDYFRVAPSTFDKDLAMCSFIAAANSGKKSSMKKFYNEIHYTIDYMSLNMMMDVV